MRDARTCLLQRDSWRNRIKSGATVCRVLRMPLRIEHNAASAGEYALPH